MLTRALTVSALLLGAVFAQPSVLTWRDALNTGVGLFKQARYAEAVEAFRQAADLNPHDAQPRLYLATALMSQWIPGADSPENTDLARRAETEFHNVLRIDPRSVIALKSLASLAYNQANPARDEAEKVRKLAEAESWYRKIIDVEPRDKEAYYSLGVIAWSRFYPALAQARARLGMRPEAPGPLADSNARQDLQARFSNIVEEGMRNLEKALELDPEYDDAMAYLNLLVRERADLRATSEEYSRDVRIADEWVQKALETKKMRANSATRGAIAGRLNGPPPMAGEPGASGNVPQRIRVGTAVQEHNLVYKVDPIYPPLALEARIQGTVRFQATIGKDGRVQHLQLISGHPLLVPAALTAVRQWIYRPTLLNGEPVEVITGIDVSFTSTQ